MIKSLIQKRSFSFLKPDVIKSASTMECDLIIKAVGYFRNYRIFKSMYNLVYKYKSMDIDSYKKSVEDVRDYLKMHPEDYIFNGFCRAVAKSSRPLPQKRLFAIMVYKQIYKSGKSFDGVLQPFHRSLCKSVSSYYDNGKSINSVLLCKSSNKIVIINKSNIHKFMFSKSWSN